MILYATIALGLLVFIHEGGHYLASRVFGVRVTEFMLGLPGPSAGFQHGRTRFGVTAIPLGGYARVCGMEPGEMSPYLEAAAASVYARGEALMEEVASDCGISEDDAYTALEELVEWGTISGPLRRDKYNTYRTPKVNPTRGEIKAARKRGLLEPVACEEGEPRPLSDPHAFFESEYRQQYRSLPFWKRSVILVAGVTVNLIAAIILFIIAFSVFGVDMQDPDTGQIMHYTVDPLRSVQAGFTYIGMVVQAVINLFNPATAAETVANSTSVVGIAYMSKVYADAGLSSFISFIAMLSVSLGVMNLLPIPPLDGGRFVVEVYQRIRRRVVSPRAMNTISYVGVALFMLLFIVMMNQDIQRFIFGNW